MGYMENLNVKNGIVFSTHSIIDFPSIIYAF